MKVRTLDDSRSRGARLLLMLAVVGVSVAAPGGVSAQGPEKGLPELDEELRLPNDDGPGRNRKQSAVKPESNPPMKVQAGGELLQGPPLSVASETYQRHGAVTADGEYVVFLNQTGLLATNTETGKTRRLADPAPYLRMTPDGEYAILPRSPLARVPIRSEGPEETFAEGHTLNRLSGPLMSNRQAAFINSKGKVVVASIDGGGSYILDLARPTDGRCHSGAGTPRKFSPDGRYLTVQHGCDSEWLVQTKRGALVKLDFISAMFAGEFVFGSPKGPKGMESVVQVRHVEKRKRRWKVKDVPYSPFRRVVPGKLAFIQVADGELQHIDLKKKKVRTLSSGKGRVTGFIEVTPDGETALYAKMGEGWCSIHAADISTGVPRRMAHVENGYQCFIRPLGNTRAAAYFWKVKPFQAIVATVDLRSGDVRRLQANLSGAGSLQTGGPTLFLDQGSLLYYFRADARRSSKEE